MNDDEPTSIDAREHLRGHREGVLIADGLAEKIKFVLESETGRIVFSTTPAVTKAAELVLFIPEEDPSDTEALQLLLAATSLDPDRDAACDRWRTYHLDPRFTRWLACTIESVRFAGRIVEPDELNQPNPLAKEEPALCRMLNADREKVAAVCQARAGVAPRDALVVGVDDTGFDVRARFGIVRIFFPTPAATAEEAEATLCSMLESPQP